MLGHNETYPIGIDIDDRHVYAAQFQQTRQGPAVRDLFYWKLNEQQTDSPEWEVTLISALKAAAKNKRFRGKRAAIHLPARHLNCFPISFRIDAGETIDMAIARECRKHLSFSLENAIIDYSSLIEVPSEEKQRFKAYIISAHRDQIDRHVRLLKRAGLSAETIDFDLSSLLRLHHYLYPLGDEPVVLCNIGQRQTLIAIVTKDSILARRTTTWGIQGLFNRLETNLELPSDSHQSAEMLAMYGLRYDDHIQQPVDSGNGKNGRSGDGIEIYRTLFQILSPYVDVLVHELYQIFGYARSNQSGIRFEKIFLYGQVNSVGALDRYLEAHLGIPTESINPILKLNMADGRQLPDTDRGASFSLALGLALRKVTWL
ncbi:MAG: pilus assembly protein PilM [Desulfobacterales bacterium]|nr:pilus assembly protein PilM [Desulfobacterales bacterium]